jgi:hypothetical protein
MVSISYSETARFDVKYRIPETDGVGENNIKISS